MLIAGRVVFVIATADPAPTPSFVWRFEALNRLGTTVVVATHDLSLIGAVMGARMMRLENGQLSDPTGELRNPPTRPPEGGQL